MVDIYSFGEALMQYQGLREQGSFFVRVPSEMQKWQINKNIITMIHDNRKKYTVFRTTVLTDIHIVFDMLIQNKWECKKIIKPASLRTVHRIEIINPFYNAWAT